MGSIHSVPGDCNHMATGHKCWPNCSLLAPDITGLGSRRRIYGALRPQSAWASSLGACGQADGVLTRYPHLLVENRGGGTFAAFAPAPFGFCSCRWKPIWERRLANSRRRKDGGRSTFAAVGLGYLLPACPNSAGGLHVHLSSGPSPGARFFSRGWRVATDTKAPDTEGSWGIVQR